MSIQPPQHVPGPRHGVVRQGHAYDGHGRVGYGAARMPAYGAPGGQLPPSGRNGLATAGFVVALIGFVLSLVPLVGIVSWLLAPVGLVLSAVGLALAGRRNAGKGLGIAGVVLGVLGLLMCLIWTAGFAAAVSEPTSTGTPAVSSASDTSTTSGTGAVRYEATGSGRGSVTYTDGSGDMGQQTSARLPWTKDIATEDSAYYSVTVSNSSGSGTVGCRIVEDGTVLAEQTAEGEYASASCSAS